MTRTEFKARAIRKLMQLGMEPKRITWFNSTEADFIVIDGEGGKRRVRMVLENGEPVIAWEDENGEHHVD